MRKSISVTFFSMVATLLVLVTSGLCVTLLMAAEVLVKYKRRRRSA